MLAPTRARRSVGVVSTSLLGVCVLLGAMSIGVFFVPALVCSIVAIVRSQRPLPVPAAVGNAVTA